MRTLYAWQTWFIFHISKGAPYRNICSIPCGTLYFFSPPLRDREWHMTAMQATCIRHQCGLVNISWHLSTLSLNSFCQLDRSDSKRIPSPSLGNLVAKMQSWAGNSVSALQEAQTTFLISSYRLGTLLSLTFMSLFSLKASPLLLPVWMELIFTRKVRELKGIKIPWFTLKTIHII